MIAHTPPTHMPIGMLIDIEMVARIDIGRAVSQKRAVEVKRPPPRRDVARLADLLTHDYYESLDIATARHPQTLLCYEMYARPLNSGQGAPLRLQIPTNLGYKQAKYRLRRSMFL